jgi:hypothetical protein
MTYEKDPRVDVYIDGLPDWPQTICQEVRELVHAADQGVIETVKRRFSPTSCLREISAPSWRLKTSALAARLSGEPPPIGEAFLDASKVSDG